MQKFAITVGTDLKGKLIVLEGPSVDVDAQVQALRDLTDANGVKKTAKGSIQVTDALLFHSTKQSIRKERSFTVAPKASKKLPPKE